MLGLRKMGITALPLLCFKYEPSALSEFFFFLRSPFYTTDSVTVRSNSLSSQTMYETKLRLRIVDSLLPHGTFFIRTYKNPSWFMLLSTGIQHRTHIAYF